MSWNKLQRRLNTRSNFWCPDSINWPRTYYDSGGHIKMLHATSELDLEDCRYQPKNYFLIIWQLMRWHIILQHDFLSPLWRKFNYVSFSNCFYSVCEALGFISTFNSSDFELCQSEEKLNINDKYKGPIQSCLSPPLKSSFKP